MLDYQGYQLDDINGLWELKDRTKELLDACIYMADNNCSLRVMQQNTGVAKSTMRDFINKDLRRISYELYYRVSRQLRNRRV